MREKEKKMQGEIERSEWRAASVEEENRHATKMRRISFSCFCDLQRANDWQSRLMDLCRSWRGWSYRLISVFALISPPLSSLSSLLSFPLSLSVFLFHLLTRFLSLFLSPSLFRSPTNPFPLGYRLGGKIDATARLGGHFAYEHNFRINGEQMGLCHGIRRFSVIQENNE